MNYFDPKKLNSYIPAATGQIVSIPLADIQAFNAMCNEALAGKNGPLTPDATTYECAVCHGTFERQMDAEWNDKKALAESQHYFGDIPVEEMAVVCDACWNKIHPERN